MSSLLPKVNVKQLKSVKSVFLTASTLSQLDLLAFPALCLGMFGSGDGGGGMVILVVGLVVWWFWW